MNVEKIFYSYLPEGFSGNGLLSKILALATTALLSLFLAALLFEIIRIILQKSVKSSGYLINKKLRAVFYTFFVVVALNLSLPATDLEGLAEIYIHKILYILFISCFAFLLIKICQFVKALIYERHDISIANNLSERKVRTQIGFIYKLAVVIIFIIAVSVILMSFDPVRELGTSILASAGIAGVIIGFAAQKSLANLLAGFQIAFTQPVRIDDVVIVEGEWGRIEEISLTYVVVRIWDQRRLIVPISHFIEKPFQNWTRVSADLLGTIFIYTDYSLPIDELRKELTRLLKESDKWDGKVNSIQVTDATEKTVQVRALVSASNSGDAWDLRCMVREKLIAFIQKNYPDSLPKVRAEIEK